MKIIINEDKIKLLLNESSADDRRKKAKKYIIAQCDSNPQLQELAISHAKENNYKIQNGVIVATNREGAEYTISPSEYLFNNIIETLGLGHNRSSFINEGRYDLGLCRMYLNDITLARDANAHNEMMEIIKFLRANPHILNNELENFNNKWSFFDLKQRIYQQAKEYNKSQYSDERDELSSLGDTPKGYTVIQVRNTEEASKYANYTSWCVTKSQGHYDSYAGKYGLFNFCLKDGFEKIKAIKGENSPYDEYGLSMIAVNVNLDGSIKNITTRWNHEVSPTEPGSSDDFAMSVKTLAKVLGCNPYSVCVPRSREELKSLGYIPFDEVQEMLDNGTDPRKIFEYYDYFYEGFARVKLNGKYNFLTKDGKILSNQWFDYVDSFDEGFASVRMNDKWNFLTQDGNLLSNQWFDYVSAFMGGFASVELNDKYNFLTQDGNILSNQWFDDVQGFREGFASVELNDKFNFINTEGKVISNQWFDYVSAFMGGFASVELNDKYNFLTQNGNLLSNQWFDDVSDFREGFARVELNDKWNFLTQNGNLLSNQWFDDVSDFNEDFAVVELNNKFNFLTKDGNLLSNQWFDDVRDFREGFARVELNNEDFLIDKNGQLYDYNTEEPIQQPLNESMKKQTRTLLNESSQDDAAKDFLKQKGVTDYKEQMKITGRLQHDIPNLRLDKRRFMVGALRMYYNHELNDELSIRSLNNALRYIHIGNHTKEYDFNLNGESLETLSNRYREIAATDARNDRERSNARQFNGGTNYKIIPINSFEEASKYGAYTSWCVTDKERAFKDYTNGGNRFYFCLLPGFEHIEEEVGEGCPLDEYGLSMIAVNVDMEGNLTRITTRWNHDHNGENNQNLETTEQLENILNIPFYSTFKPYTRDELHQKGIILFDEVQEMLDNGTDPRDIFEYYDYFDEGFARVKLNGKYNFLTKDGKILSNQWFDYVDSFYEGFARVRLNNKYNFLTQDGNFLSNKWFDWVDSFDEGFASVRMNDKWNFLTQNGNLLSNQWFDDVSDFNEDFAVVELNDKWNFLTQNGNLLSNQWFDDVQVFREGFASVELNDKWNFLTQNGNLLSNQWFDDICPFDEGFARVKLNNEEVLIDTEGNIYNKYNQPISLNESMKKQIIISEKQINVLNEAKDEITFFSFFNELKQFIVKLLETPVEAAPSDKLKEYFNNASKKDIINKLADSDIVRRNTKIKETSKEETGDGKSRVDFMITFSVPKKGFKEKIHDLYDDTVIEKMVAEKKSFFKDEEEMKKQILNSEDGTIYVRDKDTHNIIRKK